MRAGCLQRGKLASGPTEASRRASKRSTIRFGRTRSPSADAGMGPEDIVRLTVYSTDPDGLKFVRAHREKYLKPHHTPASTWVVVSRLANPKWVVEMETVAAKA